MSEQTIDEKSIGTPAEVAAFRKSAMPPRENAELTSMTIARWNAFRRRVNPWLRWLLRMELTAIMSHDGDFIGVGIRWQLPLLAAMREDMRVNVKAFMRD